MSPAPSPSFPAGLGVRFALFQQPDQGADMKTEQTIKTIAAVQSQWIGKETWYAIRQIDYRDGRSERFTDTRVEYTTKAAALQS